MRSKFTNHHLVEKILKKVLLFAKILDKNDISFLSLQKGFGTEQIEECSFKEKFVNCQREIDIIWDFHEMSAIISNPTLQTSLIFDFKST